MKKILRYKDFLNENIIKQEMTLPDDVIKIADEYHKADKDIFVVGGAVRDFLQGKTPHDYDLVTNALPEESKQILKNWNISDEQGKNFGVLRVYTEDEPLGYEIATYRKDISPGRDTKGNDQKVEIGSHITINDDVLRRDLTINSLFYDINKKEIVDLVGGIEDIKNNIIRAVGEPSQRFNEDRLRILRVFRFAARTGGEIDEKTAEAIKKDNRLKGINPKEDVSQERIIEEFYKVIEHAEKGGKNILQKYLDLLTEFDMWKQIFPGVTINKNIKIESLKDAIIFADLFENDNIARRPYYIKNLRLSTELINEMDFLYKLNDVTDPKNIYKLAKLKDRYHIADDLILEYAKIKNINMKNVTSFLKYCDDGFKISGDDLMAQGFKEREIEIEKIKRETERYINEYL